LVDRHFLKVGIGSSSYGLWILIRHSKFLLLTGLTYKWACYRNFSMQSYIQE